MDAYIADFISELRQHAEHEISEYMAAPENSFAPDRRKEDHFAWKAAIILQAIFDPENQPSQFGTQLLETASAPSTAVNN